MQRTVPAKLLTNIFFVPGTVSKDMSALTEEPATSIEQKSGTMELLDCKITHDIDYLLKNYLSINNQKDKRFKIWFVLYNFLSEFPGKLFNYAFYHHISHF